MKTLSTLALWSYAIAGLVVAIMLGRAICVEIREREVNP